MSNDPKKTVFAKVIPAGVEFHLIDWTPWRNTKDTPQMHRLILHNWIRSRGGLGADEEFDVTVYTYDEDAPKWPNGKPMRCDSTVYHLAPKEAKTLSTTPSE